MENIVKSAAFMDLYNQQYPAAPELPPMITEVVQSVAASPSPASPSGGNNDNGKFIRNVLILAGLGLAIYGGYSWYKYKQAKKDKKANS